MANAMYPKGLEKILEADIDFGSDTFKLVLLDADASYSASDEYLDDVNSDAVATSGALANGSTSSPGGGAFDADDVTYSSQTGDPVAAVVLIKDTGSAATSPLICWWDTEADTSSVDITPNGGDIDVTFGAGGLFTL